MKTLISLFCLFWLFNISLAEEPLRIWTSSDGRTLEAKFIELVGDSVKVKNTQDREFVLPLIKLSKADQEYVIQASLQNLYSSPNPFDDRGSGGIIIASTEGNVRVIHVPRYTGSLELKPLTRDAIVGESLPKGSTIITGSNSEADLLFTNGSLAKVRADSKLVLKTFWQKSFQARAEKVSKLEEEISPSRIALKLEIGELVVDVKKLNKESSFMVESKLGVAGVRGTQFGFSVDSKSTELVVLEGKVGFKDTNQKIKIIKAEQKAVGTDGGASDIVALPETKKGELANAVAETREVIANYDLTRLANTVDGYAPKSNYIVKSALDMELIWCPPGSFIMGDKNDGPPHPVILTMGFYLGEYEITQEQYEKIMGNNPSLFKGDKLPVEQVTWFNAMAFCKALTKKERVPRGWEFALPTEAQWEFACRAGTTTSYSWGKEANPKLANYKESGINKTTRVGAYPPNPWGFYDLHGNVMEWCQDWYGAYPNEISIDPTGPNAGERRVLRGAAWNYDSGIIRSSNRMNFRANEGQSSSQRGFRVCFQSSK